MPDESEENEAKKGPSSEQLEEALWVFNLKPGASLEEIKKRKAFLSKTMHEDVVAESLKEEAHEQMIQINAAWEVLNAWFQANPGLKEIPKVEGSKEGATDSGANKTAAGDSDFDDDDDPEEWNNWKQKQQNRWSGRNTSLEELDRKRRYDITVNARRDYIIKCKFGVAMLIVVGFLLAPFSINIFTLWWIMIIAYLIWMFHPKAKEVTEKWIRME